MKRLQITVALFSVFYLLGCMEGPSDPPVLPFTDMPTDGIASEGRIVLGIFDVYVDRSSAQPVTLTPLRLGSFHANIRSLLEENPCTDCFRVVGFQPFGDGFDIEMEIEHPFGSSADYYGFDVRGTAFLKGSFVFPHLGISASSPVDGDAYLGNADGWTTLFNPTDYGNGGLLGYSRGKLVPKYMPAPNTTLGAFKAYYSEGQSEDEGGRRAFYPGDTISRPYRIIKQEPGPLQFGYVIDACWAPPLYSPPTGSDDFPASANCPEPFRVDITASANSLSMNGGGVIVTALAYDHQGTDNLFQGILEAPGLTDELIYDYEPEIIGGNLARYMFMVPNALGNADPDGEEALVMVVHNEPDPNLGLIPAMAFAVLDIAPDNLGPQIFAIDPDSGYQGSTVQATIIGSGFQDGADIEMYQSISSIPGYDVSVEDQFTLEAFFDLDGPEGLYTIYAENPDGKWGELQDAFELLKSPTGCSDAFHTDTLGTGAIDGMCAIQYDCAFLVDGPFAGGMIATMQNMAGHSMVAVDVDTTTPSDPIQLPDALGGVGWLDPWTIDVDESSGDIFISWRQLPQTVYVYSSCGEPVAWMNIQGIGEIIALDTDGEGGFWVAFNDYCEDPTLIHHYKSSVGLPGFELEDTIEIDPLYGRVEEIAVLPDSQRLYVLCSASKGTILSFDIADVIAVSIGFVDHLFPAPLPTSMGSRDADIEIDQTDPDSAGCRIVVMGNQGADSCMVLKMDRDLNVLAQVSLPQSYQAIAVNPDPDVMVHHVTLFPAKKEWCTYRLLETPEGW
jgi:hypothetical protein